MVVIVNTNITVCCFVYEVRHLPSCKPYYSVTHLVNFRETIQRFHYKKCLIKSNITMHTHTRGTFTFARRCCRGLLVCTLHNKIRFNKDNLKPNSHARINSFKTTELFSRGDNVETFKNVFQSLISNYLTLSLNKGGFQ